MGKLEHEKDDVCIAQVKNENKLLKFLVCKTLKQEVWSNYDHNFEPWNWSFMFEFLCSEVLTQNLELTT